MKTEDSLISYKKRSRQLGFTSASALYEADDHLLLVEGWVRQRSRRFYFDRIQAIIVRPTFRMGLELIVTGLMLAFLLGITALVTANTSSNDDALAAMIGMIILTLPFLLIFLFSLVRFLIRGASQDVFIKTAVQSSRIPPLGYRRASRRHLADIRQSIENAQGGPLSQESLEESLHHSGDTPPPLPQILPPELPSS